MALAKDKQCVEEAVCSSQRDGDVKEEQASESSSRESDSSGDLEPEWLDDIQNNGELFYLELSEGEEELALAQAAPSTNHVHFSEQEAEIFTDQKKKQRGGGSRPKGEPTLKRLARILRRKCRAARRRRGKDESAPPASILKNQPSPRQGVRAQLKEVCVYLNPKRLGASSTLLGAGNGLLETLLGVVHRPAWSRGLSDPAEVRPEERLRVDGLVPNSPACKSDQILIGDVIVAMDDVEVTSENIERVLSCIPGPTQVRLTLETVAPLGRSGGDVSLCDRELKARPPVSQLVRLLWGEDAAELQMSVDHLPHVVMFLSLRLDSTSTRDEEEIWYQFPLSEASKQLKAVRGIFLTLCDMLDTVTGGHIVSSSLLLGKHLVHVGYWKEGNNLLVIGLPAESAFCQKDLAPRLDHFFCLFFQQLIQPTRLRRNSSAPPDVPGTLFLDGLPAVRWLTLPPEIKVEVDTILSDFESSDFGEMSEDHFGLRRLYVILGSCLFYKSYLIANHLPKEDLLDVSLYLQHYCLLPLTSEQRVGQLVVWREVFPQQRANGSAGSTPGYAQTRGRHFLLIVGLRHFLQCVLLESGGCASQAVGCLGPDCVYVDQVKATLLQLETLESAVEERLKAPSTPCLSCADWFLPDSPSPILSKLAGAVRGRGLFGERSRRSSPQRSLSDSEVQAEITLGVGLANSKKLGARRDSLGSDGSVAHSKTPRRKPPNPFHLSSPSPRRTLTERESEQIYQTMKLSSGAENTLFHYVLMETMQGIFIAPTHSELSQLGGSIHPRLVRNFHHCCLSIRAAFQQSLPPTGRRAAYQASGGGWGLGPVKEHGVLFQCKPENWTDQKKPAPTMTYWVIGRMLLEPVPQEFYVCFHDSVPEVPVEMAFRLSFGLAV
ncbi:protein inturned isoform X3 [Gouania willdenowi]|uniref:protein inturned isoform X3 n=1 Tax=Gouania willdenowi TaxID=441366 RepID=UPI0010554056|nr:protein inturned isoform X3 [Gouania willdenowi]